MIQAVVAFLGISGLARAPFTFLKVAAQMLSFQQLTAGALIGRARDARIAHDQLRLQDIAEIRAC